MNKILSVLIILLLFLDSNGQKVECNYIRSGHIDFHWYSSKLGIVSVMKLHQLALQMKSASQCRVVVIGHGSGTSKEMQLSWNRVNSCINYLVVKEHINREQFIFMYGVSGTLNTVDFRPAKPGEEGPDSTPPPFPNLRR